MARTLHFTLPPKELHPAFSELISTLQSEAARESFTLHIANALWGQESYRFLPDFTGLINRYYEGGFYTVDFISHIKGARTRINRWVKAKTENKITNLLQPGDIDSLTRLVLTNAIYFKGKWASPFKKKATKTAPFTVSPEKFVQVPLMFQEGRFPYYEDRNGDLQVLELPYTGDSLAMVVFLPGRTQGLAWFERNLTVKKIRAILALLQEKKVMVYLPRFRLKARYSMGSTLSEMGMPDAFSNMADFSGMTGRRELKISRIIHQAYVDVSEEGTEAAAATAVVTRLKALVRQHVFRADHPFLFMIIDKKSKSILFMGRMVNPHT